MVYLNIRIPANKGSEISGILLCCIFAWSIAGANTMGCGFDSGTRHTVFIDIVPPDTGTASGAGNYRDGSRLMVIAEPVEDYLFVGWYENDALVSSNAEYIFTVDRDFHLKARFAGTWDYIRLTLHADPPEGGDPEGAGAYEFGELVSISANPDTDAGYSFAVWLRDDGTVFSNEPDHVFMIQNDMVLTARYVIGECVPDCTGVECGLDPLCGEDCGGCGHQETCEGGVCVDQASDNCLLPWGGTISANADITAYESASVPCGETCRSEQRICSNGTLSGTYTHQNCSVEPQLCSPGARQCMGNDVQICSSDGCRWEHEQTCGAGQSCNNGSCDDDEPASCELPWGGNLSHGGSITAYQQSSVPCGQTCISEQRSCSNGSLSGSYREISCTVEPCRSCPVPWGGTIPHMGSVQAFQVSSVACGQSCPSPQTRVCDDGQLSGSYTHQSCTPASTICQQNSKRCTGNNVEQCSSDGCVWNTIQNCASDGRECKNGQCCHTCASLGKQCGSYPDGCGRTVTCGPCSGHLVCHNGQCEDCYYIQDYCGTSQTQWCYQGQCRSCSSGFYNCNRREGCECEHGCVGTSCCVPHTCASLGKQCGTHSNGCGGTINCGSCSGDLVCHEGQCENCYYIQGYCGTSQNQWCYQGQCRTCSSGYMNCTRVHGCECLGTCVGTSCDGTCHSGIPSECP